MDTAVHPLAPALAVITVLLMMPGPVRVNAPAQPPPGLPAPSLAGTAADDPPPLTPVRDPTPAEPPAPLDTMIVTR